MLNGKMKAVIDEDLPRSVGGALGELGWEVKEVRDTDLLNVGWNGKTLPACPAPTALSRPTTSQLANALSALQTALNKLGQLMSR